MKYALWLSNIPGIGRTKIEHLRTIYGEAKEIYERSEEQLREISQLTDKDVYNILQSKASWNLEQKLFELNELGISFLSQEQNAFPERLREIVDAPFSIYYKGKLPDENKKMVAMVGARGRSAYGREITRRTANLLAEQNVQTISGMARGIDTDCHIGTLEKNGCTFAVLGCGVDICYPQQNRFLYDEIPKHGAIISEYPIGTVPKPQLFPARNRIISAFCDCVIVFEARKKSGSLITADYAMEQGKEVYALPGRVTDSLSEGCNSLIKQGAGVITSPEEFYSDWQMIHHTTCTQLDFRQSLLEKEELLVYSSIEFDPIGIGSLLEIVPLSLNRILQIIENLEEKGYIKETIPNYYIRMI